MKIRVVYKTYGNELRPVYKSLARRCDHPADVFNPDCNVGILAIAGRPVGSAKLDIGTSPPRIGWLYVDSNFRGKEMMLEDTPWLGVESGYRIWQYMVKAAYLIARRAGYSGVESNIHNERGEQARQWRDSQMPRWEAEVALLEPQELIDLIKAR